MTVVSSTTIIAAPPSKVRNVFLDWPNVTSWDTSYMKTFTILAADGTPDPSKSNGYDVVPGDKVHGTFWGGEANIEILENTTQTLQWKGLWHGLVAIRTFSFEETEGASGVMGTKFVQSEECKGFMGAVLTVDGWIGGSLKKKFDKMGADLRVKCEQ